MALYLYRKYKQNSSPKAPPQREPCIHQRGVSVASDVGLISESNELDDFAKTRAEKNQQLSHNTTNICDICKDEKRQMNHYRRRLMLGLFFPFLVQSLDVTIIAGALPFIASDFRKSLERTLPHLLTSE
jgi:hypothetical protein